MKRPATYSLWAGDTCLYVGATEHIGSRLTNHSNDKPWWPEVDRIAVTHHESIEAARRAEADDLIRLAPRHNSVRTYVAPTRVHYVESAAEQALSVRQAARELNLSPRAVLHRIHAGTIAAIKLGPGTAGYVITRAEVERAKAEAAA